jgi:hypothetical protein
VTDQVPEREPETVPPPPGWVEGALEPAEGPPSEDREQCPGHETDAGTVTHALYPDDCQADGFDV